MSEAVIYCRVSSERQAREGDGVRSQEQRCRTYVEIQGYRLLCTFTDDGVSGAAVERPGLQAMLDFLRSRKAETIVVIDDISRIARDVSAHFRLRAAIKISGGRLESPSFTFGDTASDELLETIMAATAQYGRKGNREQVLNRMRARLEMGYWTFPAPPGFAYERHPLHKKLLVPSEAARKILRPALEGYASGRFATQREMALFLRDQGFFKDRRPVSVTTLEKRVSRIMDSLALYAGMLEYPAWNVTRRQAQHQGIITSAALSRIEERIEGVSRSWSAPRMDSKETFPLRNFVRCRDCGRPLTASFAKRRYRRYYCYGKDCPLYGHSFSADKILEPAFIGLLESLEPHPHFMEALNIYLPSVFERIESEWEKELRVKDEEKKRVRGEVEGLVRRLSRVSDAVAEELENEIAMLKAREKALEREMAISHEGPKTRGEYDQAWEAVSTWFREPAKQWVNGSGKQKRTVHRLVFTTAPMYEGNGAFSAYDLSLPYLISATFTQQKSHMVDLAGESWRLNVAWDKWVETICQWAQWLD